MNQVSKWAVSAAITSFLAFLSTFIQIFYTPNYNEKKNHEAQPYHQHEQPDKQRQN